MDPPTEVQLVQHFARRSGLTSSILHRLVDAGLIGQTDKTYDETYDEATGLIMNTSTSCIPTYELRDKDCIGGAILLSSNRSGFFSPQSAQLRKLMFQVSYSLWPAYGCHPDLRPTLPLDVLVRSMLTELALVESYFYSTNI
jgi:hypothetical protein